MAIRTDLYTIDWDASPRVINIDISVTEASLQDLYDTCRYLETVQMDELPVVDGAGGEPLGQGTSVGLTISLINATYRFADRPGPDWVVCNMAGGNVVAFTDATKTVQIYPRTPSAYVSADRTASSSATIIGLDECVVGLWDVIIEGGYTAADILQLAGSILTGKVSGVGTDTEVFLGLDDSTPRVTTTLDATGNRTGVVRNV